MGIRSEKTGSTCVIKGNGEFTASQMQEARKLFIKSLIDSDDVVVDFREITAADLTCLQLLCSAHRSAGRLHKRFRFAGNARPPALNSAAEAAGFLRACGCSRDIGQSCLWAPVNKRSKS
jgi:anti-anti-sigma regulatory factor